MTDGRKFSYCRNCAAYCGTAFDVVDGRIAGHGPDRANPLSRGFMCVKGDMAVDLHMGREARLTQCMRRTETGEFVPVAANRMLDAAAERLDALMQAHGPRSVGIFYGTCAYQKSPTIPIAKEFMQAIGSPNLFSTMTLDQSAHWVTEGRMGVFQTGRPHFDDVDVMLLSGTNPVVSHGSVYLALPTANQTEHIKRFRARGGKLIVVDPRRTETARHADIHLQPRPGQDAAIFAAIIHVVLAEGWEDKAFCDRHAIHVDALRAAVAPFTPEMVAMRAGVRAEDLVAVARIVRTARRPAMTFGTGTSMAAHPNTAAHMIYALNALRGGYAREGDLVRNPGRFLRRATQEGVIPPRRSWLEEPRLRTGHGQLYGEFPSSQLAGEILADGPGRIRALIVVGGNPVMAMGSPELVRRAFDSLDLLIVLDPRLTETARHADYIVAPPLQYEVHDTSMLTDLTSPLPFVQYTQPVVEPPAGTLEEWTFFHEMAKRLGHVLAVRPFGFGADSNDPDAQLPLTHDRAWTTCDIVAWQCNRAGIDLEALKAHPHGLLAQVDMPVIRAPDNDDGARLDLCPPDVAQELAAIAAEVEDMAPAPFMLVSRRIVEAMNSAFRNATVTRRRYATNLLYMHPDDMAANVIADGDPVAIEGQHGRIMGKAKSDATLRCGVVAMTHCWGGDDPDGSGRRRGAHSGELVSLAIGDVQAIDGMPRQSGLPVHIRKAMAAA